MKSWNFKTIAIVPLKQNLKPTTQRCWPIYRGLLCSIPFFIFAFHSFMLLDSWTLGLLDEMSQNSSNTFKDYIQRCSNLWKSLFQQEIRIKVQPDPEYSNMLKWWGVPTSWGKRNGHRVKLSRAESSWVKLTNSSHLVTEFLPDSDPPVTRCLFANQPPATYGKLNLDESWLDLGDGIFVLAFHTQQNMQYTVHSVHTAAYMLTQLSMVESLCGNCRSKALLLQKTSRRKRRLKTCLPPFAPCSSHAWACHEKIHGTLVLLILKI